MLRVVSSESSPPDNFVIKYNGNKKKMNTIQAMLLCMIALVVAIRADHNSNPVGQKQEPHRRVKRVTDDFFLPSGEIEQSERNGLTNFHEGGRILEETKNLRRGNHNKNSNKRNMVQVSQKSQTTNLSPQINPQHGHGHRKMELIKIDNLKNEKHVHRSAKNGENWNHASSPTKDGEDFIDDAKTDSVPGEPSQGAMQNDSIRISSTADHMGNTSNNSSSGSASSPIIASSTRTRHNDDGSISIRATDASIRPDSGGGSGSGSKNKVNEGERIRHTAKHLRTSNRSENKSTSIEKGDESPTKFFGGQHKIEISKLNKIPEFDGNLYRDKIQRIYHENSPAISSILPWFVFDMLSTKEMNINSASVPQSAPARGTGSAPARVPLPTIQKSPFGCLESWPYGEHNYYYPRASYKWMYSGTPIRRSFEIANVMVKFDSDDPDLTERGAGTGRQNPLKLSHSGKNAFGNTQLHKADSSENCAAEVKQKFFESDLNPYHILYRNKLIDNVNKLTDDKNHKSCFCATINSSTDEKTESNKTANANSTAYSIDENK